MRSPDEIFGDEFHVRTVLFEEGEWCIYQRDASGCVYNYIIHRCDKVVFALDGEGYWRCGEVISGETTGHGCGEEAPDSIKTLYILHRWDR